MVAGDLTVIADQVESVAQRDVLGCKKRRRHAGRKQRE